MSGLDALLHRNAGSGIYRAPAAPLADYHAEVERRGWDAADITADVASKQDLLRVLGANLAFPDWFGHNWDALDDCLRDLSWLPAEAHVVLWDQPDRLATADPATAREAIAVFVDTVAWWRAQGGHFSVVLVGADPHGAFAGFPELA